MGNREGRKLTRKQKMEKVKNSICPKCSNTLIKLNKFVMECENCDFTFNKKGNDYGEY